MLQDSPSASVALARTWWRRRGRGALASLEGVSITEREKKTCPVLSFFQTGEGGRSWGGEPRNTWVLLPGVTPRVTADSSVQWACVYTEV